jgi:hypothetical protein
MPPVHDKLQFMFPISNMTVHEIEGTILMFGVARGDKIAKSFSDLSKRHDVIFAEVLDAETHRLVPVHAVATIYDYVFPAKDWQFLWSVVLGSNEKPMKSGKKYNLHVFFRSKGAIICEAVAMDVNVKTGGDDDLQSLYYPTVKDPQIDINNNNFWPCGMSDPKKVVNEVTLGTSTGNVVPFGDRQWAVIAWTPGLADDCTKAILTAKSVSIGSSTVVVSVPITE